LRRGLHEFRRTPTPTLPLIVVLGVIIAFDAMAIDLYLPGFRDIGRSLGANPGTMQTSLSVFVGGAAIGQLLKRTEI
jgi:DHA1 family bicyclomycin/chloramphenicol resistance-like MFS transporter